MSIAAFRRVTDDPIVLDLRGCRYPDEVHDRIQAAFGFPAYYGKNWDAMWDCIDGLFSPDEARTIEVGGFDSLPPKLRDYTAPMWDIFAEVQRDCPRVTVRKAVE